MENETMMKSITRWILCPSLVRLALLPIILLGIVSVAAFAAGTYAASNMFTEAASLMESGKTEEAISVYDNIIQHARFSREVYEALYRKGLCFQAMKQDQEAISCWKTLLTRYSNTDWDDDALLEMGNLYATTLNQPEKARSCYTHLIRNYPRSERFAEAQFQLGVAAYVKGNYGKARESFNEVLRKDPQGGLAKEAQEWLDRTTMALNGAPGAKLTPKTDTTVRKYAGVQRDLADEIEEGETFKNKGKIKEALIVFRQIVKNGERGDGYDRALYRLGQCQAELGRDKQALESWEEMLKWAKWKHSEEWADDALLAMAETWMEKLEEPDKTMKYCQTLLTEYPESELIPQAQHLIGLVHFYQGEHEKALAIFEKELDQRAALEGMASAGQASGLNTNGVISRKEEVLKPPSTGLERLIAACRECEPSDADDLKISWRADPLIRKGDMYFTDKNYAKAQKAYEKAAREAPMTERAAYALMQAGRCLSQMRQYRQALWCYEQFLTKYKGSQYADDALVRAGVIYVGPLRDMASGAKIYTMILERYPDSNEAETAQYHLATLAYWKKDFKQALALYRRVTETWPEGRYAEFIVAKRAPELEGLIKTKSKTKRGTT